MDLDDKVCYCFHVTRRKLENYVRRERPKVPSQLSECGGAGTGCGWCIPFLKQIFQQGVEGGETTELERLTPEEYEKRRAEFFQILRDEPHPEFFAGADDKNHEQQDDEVAFEAEKVRDPRERAIRLRRVLFFRHLRVRPR